MRDFAHLHWGGKSRIAGNSPGPDKIQSCLAELAQREEAYRSVRPWLMPREEDSILIVPPNLVYKLGGAGFPLMQWLDEGHRVVEIPGMNEERAKQCSQFLEAIVAVAEGRRPESMDILDTVPYGFDFSRLPILGELALTYRCNARCRFCYAGCGGEGELAAIGHGREVSTKEAKQIIDIFRNEAKIPFFSFTGGEPLLRPDLEELAAYACSIGLRVNLITNGTLITPKRAVSLARAGIDSAQVSLESPDSRIHDALCGLPGAWDKTVSGIKSLQDAGIAVQTNSTLTAINRDSLYGYPEFASTLGIKRFSMNLFIPSGRGLGQDDLTVHYVEVPEFIDMIRQSALRCGITFFWYSPVPYCIYNPVAKGLGNKSCAAMDGLIHVNPEGNILPCSSWPEKIGNILEQSFHDLWFSRRASYFKQKKFAPEACSGCDSFIACQGGCPLYMNTLGDGEIILARRVRHGC